MINETKPEAGYTVRKDGDNYGLYFRKELVETFATRATANKWKLLSERDRDTRLKRKTELQAVIQRAWSEIIADVNAGKVPVTVAHEGELHDHVDANKYGGAFEKGAHRISDVDFWNAVHMEIDIRIQAGDLKREVGEKACL
jgi:hypothetical protein